jgi:hypothetical protein
MSEGVPSKFRAYVRLEYKVMLDIWLSNALYSSHPETNRGAPNNRLEPARIERIETGAEPMARINKDFDTNRVEIAPGVYYFTFAPKSAGWRDFADGFCGRPFAGAVSYVNVSVDLLRSDETRKVVRPTARMDDYWDGQRLRRRLNAGELIVREGDHLVVPPTDRNAPCTCGVAALAPARPDERLPLNFV